jgi:anti-sigma regulatory factor (Ser/Thr protein kinase)
MHSERDLQTEKDQSAVSNTGLRHEAFVYDSDDGFAGRMAQFLEAGLEEGAAVVAVTTRSNWASLRDMLGTTAEQVSFTDRDTCYVRPASAIAAYDATLRHHLRGGAPSVRVLAEVQFGPTPEEWDEWTAYEAIANRAFAEHAAWITCAYDARVLPDQVVEGAWRTHPQVMTGALQESPHFDEAEELVRTLTREPEPLPELHPLRPGDDVSLREQLAAELAAARIPKAIALNMLLATDEIIANAWRYAEGPEMLRAGLVRGQFVCEVSDGGRGFDDPLAGYIPPGTDQKRAPGLWIARQLVSRLEFLPSADGLGVRLWL